MQHLEISPFDIEPVILLVPKLTQATRPEGKSQKKDAKKNKNPRKKAEQEDPPRL